MGDSSLTVESLALNYDACAFFSGWTQSIRDSQVRRAPPARPPRPACLQPAPPPPPSPQINPVDGHPAGSLADTTPHTFGS